MPTLPNLLGGATPRSRGSALKHAGAFALETPFRRQSWAHPDAHQSFGCKTPDSQRPSALEIGSLGDDHKPSKVGSVVAGSLPSTAPSSPAGDEASKRWVESMNNPATKMEFITMLRKIKIFKIRSNQFLEVIAAKFKPVVHKLRTRIISQGDVGDWMAICLTGVAEVMVTRTSDSAEGKISELRPGMTVGELAVLGISQKRDTSIVAKSDTTMLVLTHMDLKGALEEFPSEQEAFMGLMDNPLEFNLDKLAETKAFGRLTDAFLSRLKEQLTTQIFAPGEAMMREGQLGDTMYILQRGTVSVEKGGVCLVELKDNAIIGEMAVVGSDKRRSATVISKDWCIVRVLSGMVFNRILEDFPSEQARFQEQSFKRMITNELPSIRHELHGWAKLNGGVHPRPPTADSFFENVPGGKYVGRSPRGRKGTFGKRIVTV